MVAAETEDRVANDHSVLSTAPAGPNRTVTHLSIAIRTAPHRDTPYSMLYSLHEAVTR